MGKKTYDNDYDKLDLYIKQGEAYLQLLAKTNALKNSRKIEEVAQKVKKAAKKLNRLA
ncbi:hypothetical protein [Zhaonella formicivorans]|uniref:hypothetical protein n=1 Tax=Zhaonella formicivorans TaxID=2528593 RepID=UPI001D0FE578|nr:hypothetical protein [Zhaonella formicivorans]